MTIPVYAALMLPLLGLASNGQECRASDAIDLLAKQFGLTDTERSQLYEHRNENIFASRVRWARLYLSQARLVEVTRRGYFRITERGKDVLKQGSVKVDIEFLMQFPEFAEFYSRGRSQSVGAVSKEVIPGPIATSETPEEVLQGTIEQIEATLKKDLIDRILKSSPTFFERLIVKLLEEMGYRGENGVVRQRHGKSGDGGIDGVIDQDALGLDSVYIQAKRYALDRPVQTPEVKEFSGSLGVVKSHKGIFVTTSSFSQSARTFVEQHPSRIVLVDGDKLTSLMIKNGVGLREEKRFILHKIDEDFFSEE